MIERHESSQHEQKPVTIDFKDDDQKIIKEWVEKRKEKRQEVAEKNKALKRQKRA